LVAPSPARLRFTAPYFLKKSVIQNNNQRVGMGSDLMNPTAERNFLSFDAVHRAVSC
jgi:hypothetical protein